MKILYVADDGTTFENEFECTDYEWKERHSHLKDISFYDKDDTIITDIFNEDSYNITEKVIVQSNEAISDFQDFTNYTGFCEYENITYPGCWIWDDLNGFQCIEKYVV